MQFSYNVGDELIELLVWVTCALLSVKTDVNKHQIKWENFVCTPWAQGRDVYSLVLTICWKSCHGV